MKLTDPTLQNLLAGEYVLGTLEAQARRRFEREMEASAPLREAVAFWEQALAPLAPAEAEAPRDLWPAIERRLGWQAASERRSPGWWPRLAFAAVAGISILLWAPWEPRFSPDFALSLSVEDSQAQWQMAVDREQGWIDLRVARGHPLPTEQDLELWLLVEGGSPISLGLIPETDGQRLRIKSRVPLTGGNGLAISIEPAGGSPSGAPTGPVIAAQRFPTA